MSKHGGKRPGGRRPGSKNQRSAEIAQQAANEGITPIEVILAAMRDFWAEGTPEAKREAAIIARYATPYVHPRLASIDQTIHEPQCYVVLEANVRAGRYGTPRLISDDKQSKREEYSHENEPESPEARINSRLRAKLSYSAGGLGHRTAWPQVCLETAGLEEQLAELKAQLAAAQAGKSSSAESSLRSARADRYGGPQEISLRSRRL
jgi:hypothetical protein